MTDRGAIYIDFDDVICETARAIAAVVAREFDKHVPFKDIASFHIGRSFDLTPAQVDLVMDHIHDPETLSALAPIHGAAEVMGLWVEHGFTVAIVTGRPPHTRDASRAWLATHDVPYSELVFVDKYARPHPPAPGVQALSLEDVSRRDFLVAIDDAPEMITFLREHTTAQVIVFDRPWNANVADAERVVTRCHGWEEVGRAFPNPSQPTRAGQR